MISSHSTMFKHVNIVLNCIYQIAVLTCVNSALPEEFDMYRTIHHTILSLLLALTHLRVNWLLLVFDAHSANVVTYVFSLGTCQCSWTCVSGLDILCFVQINHAFV